MAVHVSNNPNGSHGGESGLNLTANDVVAVRLVGGLVGPSTLQLANSPPPPDDALARLERLKKLLDDGAIDQGQFERLRDQIV
ncbi:SHOCT domain-containing protein [Aminobacter sp. P9b]|uniref:SHOCT domain-containing protein n=1 Tax=Aminobacter sp. P9b TaxID=3133697 RepID=UPI0032455360